MMAGFGRRHAVTAMVSAAALVGFAAGGLTIASAGGTSSTLHACANHKGTLSLLTKHGKCGHSSHKVSVDEKGIRGSKGPRGPKGTAGANAKPVTASFSSDAPSGGRPITGTPASVIDLTTAAAGAVPGGEITLPTAATLVVQASLGFVTNSATRELGCHIYAGTDSGGLSAIGDWQYTESPAGDHQVQIGAHTALPAGKYKVAVDCYDAGSASDTSFWTFYHGELQVIAIPS